MLGNLVKSSVDNAHARHGVAVLIQVFGYRGRTS